MENYNDADGKNKILSPAERIRIFKKKKPAFISFYSAQQRCQNSKHRSYKYYGGRGIEFRFKSYNDIVKEIGPRPKNHSLGRIDNNGHYENGNIKWETLIEQARNRSNNVLNPRIVAKARRLFANGWKLCKLSKKFGIGRTTLSPALYGKTWIVIGDEING